MQVTFFQTFESVFSQSLFNITYYALIMGENFDKPFSIYSSMHVRVCSNLWGAYLKKYLTKSHDTLQ